MYKSRKDKNKRKYKESIKIVLAIVIVVGAGIMYAGFNNLNKNISKEDNITVENEESFQSIANQVSTPLATGERLITRWEYKRLFQQGAVDIIQPDVALCGGILETKKIVSMAEAYDMAAAPHAPYGPIALAATLQVDVCSPNVFIQEQSLGIHYNKGFDLLDFIKNKEVFQYKDGYVDIPKKPGLGLEIDEDMVKEVSAEGLHWTNPKWRNYDGTMAEW